jgi:L-asparaginase/Glu-tRNA(Gln) amidotransferase subunit D
VDIGAYETGSELKKLGLMDGYDMTIEACVTKLAYLMGKGMKGSELKSAFESDLRGEVSSRDRMKPFNAPLVSRL